MSTKPQIELFLENESGTQQVAYPFVESDHVSLSNGMDIDTMIRQDVSMPTVAHEDLSFKVGVGDQDVSSAIVDSSVAEMTIKGKTYQNILPEPSTHVLTNNKEMFKVNEGLDSNVEIVDAVSKSAILSGNTLVNLTKTIHGNGNINAQYRDVASIKLELLKPSTKYIAYVFNDGEEDVALYWNSTANFQWKEFVCKSKTMTYSIGTSKASFNDNDLVFSVNTSQTLPQSLRCVILEYQEGMENWDIPYFEGMTSCKMPVLTTTGKNLCKYRNNWTYGGLTFTNTENGVTVNGTATVYVDYYVIDDRNINLEVRNQLNSLPVGTRLILSNNLGKNSYISYTLNGEVRYADNVTIQNNMEIKGAFVRFQEGDICNNLNLTIQLEVGNEATSYEPYKTNILSTPEEVVLRSLPNGVKDTLNCMTGEYVQHIKEVVFDGSSDGSIGMVNVNDTALVRFNINNVAGMQTGNTNKVLCSSLPYLYIHGLSGGSATVNQECISNHSQDANVINIVIKRSRLSSVDVAGFRAYLQSNPITIQYSIATPIVKTVDLSSSGNWEKVVLDGSEDESWGDGDNGLSKTHRFYVTIPNLLSGNHSPIIDSTYFTPIQTGTSSQDTPCVQIASNKIHFRIERQIADSLTSFKTWLQQNPLTVWYPTTTHQDSTQVKQPIFFKDGHIQLSSGADNSLIPTLDYQAKTSNSYVMDLMKANTRYTMKAKSASGTFTIDGASYGAGTNGTFTTPSSMTNKLLVMSNNANEEVMILEGDVTDKTIPYFKGIKSAFEDEDKIEVLSTGKNLFDGAFEKGIIDVNGNPGYSPSAIRTVNYISVKPNASYHINLPNLEPFESFRVVYVHEYDENFKVLGEKQVDNRNIYTSKSATKFIKINTHTAHDLPVDSKMIVCENSTLDKQYEPYKSNSTKIPLLSPLRSLPNGVCDEIVLDRENNKAKIIQRVGKVTYDGTDVWGKHTVHNNNVRIQTTLPNCVRRDTAGFIYAICDKLPSVIWNYSWLQNYNLVTVNLTNLHLQLSDTTMTKQQMLSWLTQNPITVQYELAEPVVTEVDLSGFPYIYKDGHIFLNGEITPVTEIKYSINQSHMIEASNQDILRQEKKLTNLQRLIGEYVRVDYNSTLLSLELELK